ANKFYFYSNWLGDGAAAAALTLHTLLASYLSYVAINRWFTQRNFQAVRITAPVFVVSFFGGVFLVEGLITYLLLIPMPLLLLGFLLGFASPVLYLWWKFRRSR